LFHETASHARFGPHLKERNIPSQHLTTGRDHHQRTQEQDQEQDEMTMMPLCKQKKEGFSDDVLVALIRATCRLRSPYRISAASGL